MMKIRLSIRQVRILMVPFVLAYSVVTMGARTQTMDKLVIYVWDFATRNGEKNELTDNLTNEFEELLIQSKRCVVLERRNYDKLLAQKENERAVLAIENISPTTLSTLKAQQATTVVFGEVYDDIESGQIKVTVVFQKFDGVKLTQQSSLFARGKRYDAESRNNAMQMLIKEIFEKSNVPPSSAILPDLTGIELKEFESTLYYNLNLMRENPAGSTTVVKANLQNIIDKVEKNSNYLRQAKLLTALLFRTYGAAIILAGQDVTVRRSKYLEEGFPYFKKSYELDQTIWKEPHEKAAYDTLRHIFNNRDLVNFSDRPFISKYLKAVFVAAMFGKTESEISAYHKIIIGGVDTVSQTLEIFFRHKVGDSNLETLIKALELIHIQLKASFRGPFVIRDTEYISVVKYIGQAQNQPEKEFAWKVNTRVGTVTPISEGSRLIHNAKEGNNKK